MEHIHRLSMTERMERQVRQVRTVKHHISMLSIVTMAVRRSLLIRERTLEHISELAPTITKQTLQRLVLTLGQESRERLERLVLKARQGQQVRRVLKAILDQLETESNQLQSLIKCQVAVQQFQQVHGLVVFHLQVQDNICGLERLLPTQTTRQQLLIQSVVTEATEQREIKAIKEVQEERTSWKHRQAL